MTPLNNILASTVNMDFFNQMLINGGGKPIKSSKKNIKMMELIKKLLKRFRKDFFKNNITKGGFFSTIAPVADSVYTYNGINDSKYSHAYNYPDLTINNSNTLPPIQNNYRDIL